MQLSPIAFSSLKNSSLPQLIKPTFGVIDTYKFDNFGEVPEVVRKYHEAVISPLTELLGCQKSELRFDHVFLAADSGETLLNWVDHCFGGVVNFFEKAKGREYGMGLWRLEPPLAILDKWSLAKIMAGDPKPEAPEPNGLKHIAYILRGTPHARETLFSELSQALAESNEPLLMTDGTTIRFNRASSDGIKLQFTNEKTGPDGFEVEIRRIPTKKDKKPATA